MNIDFLTKNDLLIFKEELLAEIRSLNASQPRKQEVLRSADVRQILSCSHATLQNLRITGALKPTKIGGTWYYNAEEVYSQLPKINAAN
ncbi:MAG: hypothetical protein FD155_3363 [Bacteroidetes bacterium]|nr:MAG: hypothetical protein FD155_3363 [Bacteroidota bacterium]